MPDFLIAAGKLMHSIAESENRVFASSPAAATNFPLTQLDDGIPSLPFRHTSISANNSSDADLNLAVNGDFENWTGASPDAPVGWTLEGSTDVTKETSNPIEESASVRVDGTIYREYEVPTETPIALRIAMAEFGATTANAIIQVIDMKTGEWLTSAGAWTTSATSLFVESNEYSASGDERVKGLVFTTNTYTVVEEDVTVLRIRLICGGENDGDEGIFDDLSMIIVPNLMSVHGHNIPKKHNPLFGSSGSSTFTNDQKTMATMETDTFTTADSRAKGTRRQPSFYYRLKDNCPFMDGTNDAFQLASFTAPADSKLFTYSHWIRKDGQDASDGYLFVMWDNGNSRKVLEIKCDATNGVTVIARNSSGTTILSHVTTAELLPPDTFWHHLLVSVDLAQGTAAARSRIRLDGVDMPDAGTATDDTIDFSAATRISVGGNIAADSVSPDLQAATNDIYFQPAYREDIDTQANREKFRLDSTGDRVDLGSDGSTPSGGQAYIYLHGTQANPVTDFDNNFGSAGAFATIGSPTSEVMFASQRYWRLAINAIPTVSPATLPDKAIELGQWVITKTQALTIDKMPYNSPLQRAHTEQRSPAGDIFRVAMSYSDTQTFSFPFSNSSAARTQWLELRDRSGGGTLVAVIVPNTDNGEVYFGFLSVDYPENHELTELLPVTIEFKEMSFVESL